MTKESRVLVSKAFLNYGSKLQDVVGCIDGCHIKISPNPFPHAVDYINRKNVPSIVLQAVALPRAFISDVSQCSLKVLSVRVLL
jgi:hypothetical protein